MNKYRKHLPNSTPRKNSMLMEQPPSVPYICPESLKVHNGDFGYIFLNVEKKKLKGEFYNNNTFNDEMRRLLNIEKNQFDPLKDGYNDFRNMFKTRKSMLKYVRKVKRQEALVDKPIIL